MAVQLSTALRNYLLDGGSFKEAFEGGELRIYAGTPPADADASEDTAALVAVPLAFGTAVDGILPKASTWTATVATDGEATHFRLVQTGDAGGTGADDIRAQGLVDVAFTDLVLTSLSLVATEPFTISAANVAFPTF